MKTRLIIMILGGFGQTGVGISEFSSLLEERRSTSRFLGPVSTIKTNV